jgi:hypothetical protein
MLWDAFVSVSNAIASSCLSMSGSDWQGFKNPHGFWVGYTGVRVGVSFFNPWQTLTPGQGLRVYPSTISHGFSYIMLPLWGLYHIEIVGLGNK